MLHKNMNKEIKKYQGCIFVFDSDTKRIYPADWIQTTADYDHFLFELHHVVPFTDWEISCSRFRKYKKMPEQNALILLPKVMHQHLENPVYKLNKNDFEKVYGINPDIILFDVNSRIKRTAELFITNPGNKPENSTYKTYNPGGSAECKTSYIHSHSADFPLFKCLTIINEEELSCFDEIYNSQKINLSCNAAEVQYAN